MKPIVEWARKWLGWSKPMTVAPEVHAEFGLYLDTLMVGLLSAHDGRWEFQYSDEFKKRDEYRTLVEFPDLNKLYENEELWQFFASRIPSTEQPDIENVLATEKIDDDDVIALLKRFGRRTITNPFELRSLTT